MKEKSLGPFTISRWHKSISARLTSGDGEDPGTELVFTCFGRALIIRLPDFLKPAGDDPREYGFNLFDQGNGYDFFFLYFGPQTCDSLTRKSWHKFLPWKEWTIIRSSIYRPDGSRFYTRDEKERSYDGYFKAKKDCPASTFEFLDYDGEKITATCLTEEREWTRGDGWFSWLKYFFENKVRRSLDISFSAEVGPQKGSYKGGILGHGIEMLPGENQEAAFRRYCEKEQRGGFKIEFIK